MFLQNGHASSYLMIANPDGLSIRLISLKTSIGFVK